MNAAHNANEGGRGYKAQETAKSKRVLFKIGQSVNEFLLKFKLRKNETRGQKNLFGDLDFALEYSGAAIRDSEQMLGLLTNASDLARKQVEIHADNPNEFVHWNQRIQTQLFMLKTRVENSKRVWEKSETFLLNILEQSKNTKDTPAPIGRVEKLKKLLRAAFANVAAVASIFPSLASPAIQDMNRFNPAQTAPGLPHIPGELIQNLVEVNDNQSFDIRDLNVFMDRIVELIVTAEEAVEEGFREFYSAIIQDSRINIAKQDEIFGFIDPQMPESANTPSTAVSINPEYDLGVMDFRGTNASESVSNNIPTITIESKIVERTFNEPTATPLPEIETRGSIIDQELSNTLVSLTEARLRNIFSYNSSESIEEINQTVEAVMGEQLYPNGSSIKLSIWDETLREVLISVLLDNGQQELVGRINELQAYVDAANESYPGTARVELILTTSGERTQAFAIIVFDRTIRIYTNETEYSDLPAGTFYLNERTYISPRPGEKIEITTVENLRDAVDLLAQPGQSLQDLVITPLSRAGVGVRDQDVVLIAVTETENETVSVLSALAVEGGLMATRSTGSTGATGGDLVRDGIANQGLGQPISLRENRTAPQLDVFGTDLSIFTVEQRRNYDRLIGSMSSELIEYTSRNGFVYDFSLQTFVGRDQQGREVRIRTHVPGGALNNPNFSSSQPVEIIGSTVETTTFHVSRFVSTSGWTIELEFNLHPDGDIIFNPALFNTGDSIEDEENRRILTEYYENTFTFLKNKPQSRFVFTFVNETQTGSNGPFRLRVDTGDGSAYNIYSTDGMNNFHIIASVGADPRDPSDPYEKYNGLGSNVPLVVAQFFEYQQHPGKYSNQAVGNEFHKDTFVALMERLSPPGEFINPYLEIDPQTE